MVIEKYRIKKDIGFFVSNKILCYLKKVKVPIQAVG